MSPAEAASRRYAEPLPPTELASSHSHQVAHMLALHHKLPSLVQSVIQHISTRICDTKHPILSLGGVPADVALKLLDHLIKEKLLKPKTLQPFVAW